MDPTMDSGRRKNRPRGTAAQVGPREEERAEARRDEHTSGTRTETVGRMADPSAEAVPWTTYLWWGRQTRRIFLLSLLYPSLRSLFPRTVASSRPRPHRSSRVSCVRFCLLYPCIGDGISDVSLRGDLRDLMLV